MVQSPSWEANWFAASQEIPRISRNPNVHYRTHKRPPPVSILGQPNPVHMPISQLLKIHSNMSPFYKTILQLRLFSLQQFLNIANKSLQVQYISQEKDLLSD